jgi:hypothetical protein
MARSKQKKPAIYLFFFPDTKRRNPFHRCRYWGSVKDIPVYGIQLPPVATFESWEQERQRSWLQKQLIYCRKKEGLCAGLPMACRERLSGKVPLPVADGRPLALSILLKRLEEEFGGLQGQELAIQGIGAPWTWGALDYLLSAGAWVFLQGMEGKKTAAKYYREKGIALPVLRRDDLPLLQLRLGEDIPGSIWYLRDDKIYVPGVWESSCPFPDGQFPCGLAAALWQGLEEIQPTT